MHVPEEDSSQKFDGLADFHGDAGFQPEVSAAEPVGFAVGDSAAGSEFQIGLHEAPPQGEGEPPPMPFDGALPVQEKAALDTGTPFFLEDLPFPYPEHPSESPIVFERPKAKKPYRARWFAGWAVFLAFCMIAPALAWQQRETIINSWPAASRYYRLLGVEFVPVDAPFALGEIDIVPSIDNGIFRLNITVALANLAATSLESPFLQISLHSEDSQLLSWFVPPPPERPRIAGEGGQILYNASLIDPPDNASEILISYVKPHERQTIIRLFSERIQNSIRMQTSAPILPGL